ncbi:DUF2007 domain-containing protein [Litorimonas sp. RW-G-Af-16]|uniref:putative signal transducing protein n=2 Tax=Litorimonas sp. RW-G-Af-16 TaxID=3241168 RepID=UPI003AAEE5D8
MASQMAAIAKMESLVICILKTVNPATLNYVEAVLKEAQIEYFIMDQNVSIIEGSIGVIPRRVMVLADDADDARQALIDADMGDELVRV